MLTATQQYDLLGYVRPDGAVHEHDCPDCHFIGSYRLRHPYMDDDGRRTGIVGNFVTMGDLYQSCGNSAFGYLVRYGIQGEYSTTETPSRHLLAPMVDAVDPYASPLSLDEWIEKFDRDNGISDDIGLADDIFNQ